VGSSASGTEAFRWTSDSGMVGLGDLTGGDFSSQAHAVSADGSVVVGRGKSDSGYEAFIWDDTNGMQSLKDILVNDFGLALQLTDWTLTEAWGISGDGLTIVGTGKNPGGCNEAWIATIPEPATIFLLGLSSLICLRIHRF
jgi:probable HAF family extracellular repeat protein